MSKFGEWLYDARRRAGLSQEKLAEKADVSKNYISIIERDHPHPVSGTLPSPSRKVIVALASALGEPEQIALQLAGYSSEETYFEGEDQDKLIAFYGDMSQSDREAVLTMAQTLWQKRRERELIQGKTLPKQESTDE